MWDDDDDDGDTPDEAPATFSLVQRFEAEPPRAASSQAIAACEIIRQCDGRLVEHRLVLAGRCHRLQATAGDRFLIRAASVAPGDLVIGARGWPHGLAIALHTLRTFALVGLLAGAPTAALVYEFVHSWPAPIDGLPEPETPPLAPPPSPVLSFQPDPVERPPVVAGARGELQRTQAEIRARAVLAPQAAFRMPVRRGDDQAENVVRPLPCSAAADDPTPPALEEEEDPDADDWAFDDGSAAAGRS